MGVERHINKKRKTPLWQGQPDVVGYRPDFQMIVNFFLYNILNCLLFTAQQLLGLAPQQETNILRSLFRLAPKKKFRERGNTRIISIFESVKGNIVWGV